MKFIFKIGPGLVASCLAASGCGHQLRQPAPSFRDGSDAQRLVTLTDYVGRDYGRAVRDGSVVSPAEYEEQIRFLADARRLAEGLLGPGAGGDPLVARLADVESRVRARESSEAVAGACRAAREEAVGRFGLKTAPSERPSLARAEALYAEACASCHGARGDAETERARQLDPPPASFRERARLTELSPYRVYNTLTFGVPGTAMASFETLPPSDRWSLAFYVFRLGHEGRSARGPVVMTLGDMAGRSDREILEGLRAASHPDAAAALAYVRREGAFQELPAGVGLDQTRSLIHQALASVDEGRWEEADRLMLDAYLQGFEPLEPRLHARDAEETREAEGEFRDMRAALARGDASAARARAQALDEGLARLAGHRGPVVPFLAAFVIYFREGVEAALLVGALLAGLRRLGRPEATRVLHAGWIAALPAGVLTWWVSERLMSLTADQRELTEGVIALLAAAVLFSLSFWMISKAEARRWMGYLRKRLEASLSRKSLFVLAGLAFLAVYREAAETVLFTRALLLEAETRRAEVWAGAAAGFLAVVIVAGLMRLTVMRLPLGPFFAVSGALLCALAISFAGSGIYGLVAAGYLPPRPVRFPDVPWMGIHPDLTGLVVQLSIAAVVAGGGFLTLRRGARS